MHLSNTDGQKLFSKSVPVNIKDCFTNQIRTSRLLLSIEWQETSSGIYRKELVVSLTDNNDPFFLYNLHLSEEDFQILKTSQGLLVNFSEFPQKFIDLIELCLQEESSALPKFILTFNVNDKLGLGNISSPSNLDIVETNPFKHLTHLSIKLVVASESAVKQYLVSCFRNLKEDKLQLQNRLTYLEKDFKEQLTTFQETLNCKVRELETVRKDLNAELAARENKYSKDLQEERERHFNKQKEEELRIEKERKEKERNFRKQIQQLESRVTALDTLNKEIQDKNFRNDDKIRDLKSKIVSLEDEIKRLNEKLNTVRHQKENLESDARHMGYLKNKINDLEQELSNQKQAMLKQQDVVAAHQMEKKELETQIEQLKVQIDIDAKSEESMKDDLVKSNNIIVRLQVEVQYTKDKIVELNKSVQELLKAEKEIESLKEKASEKSQELAELKIKVKSLSETISSLRGKNTSLEKELKTKENVIKWLNRQLTDRCIVPQYIPPSNIVSSPSNVIQTLTNKLTASNLDKSPKIFTSLDTVSSKAPLSGENQSPALLKDKNPRRTSFKTPSYASDSAYETSPSFSTNPLATNSPKTDTILETNEVNLDIDQSALSAAFKNDRIVKHSTAKKPSNFKNLSKGKKT